MAQTKTTLKRFLCVVLTAGLLLTPAGVARTADAPIIIRDTEIETAFKGWISPLLKAAGMGENSVDLILVQSPQINAFVAGGANIFLYTGLIDRTENPSEIVGVLAHELGHVEGGHLVGMRAALERASYESILGIVLGIGAAIVTGNGGAANAIITGSGSMAQSRFLAHSRINESSADQAAMRLMESTAINPRGMGSFLEKLQSEELLPSSQQSEYVRTHPLTRDRIDAVETRIEQSAYKDEPIPAAWTEQHARIKAKLLAFINPGRVPWVYDDKDASVPARYARAIAAYRQKEVDKALSEIDSLIRDEPDNPYFHEMKGQMLRDFGRLAEARPYYEKAVALLPDAGLIRIDLAHVILESGGAGADDQAIDHLERALRDEPRSAHAHRLLATAYGRKGEESRARLHLAEEALMQGRLPYARQLAEGVIKTAGEGSREALQARDIINQADQMEILQNR